MLNLINKFNFDEFNFNRYHLKLLPSRDRRAWYIVFLGSNILPEIHMLINSFLMPVDLIHYGIVHKTTSETLFDISIELPISNVLCLYKNKLKKVETVLSSGEICQETINHIKKEGKLEFIDKITPLTEDFKMILDGKDLHLIPPEADLTEIVSGKYCIEQDSIQLMDDLFSFFKKRYYYREIHNKYYNIHH